MYYTIIVARPINWTPKNIQDRPNQGVVEVVVEGTEYEADQMARGFNESELDNPKGYWAVTSPTAHRKGETIQILTPVACN